MSKIRLDKFLANAGCGTRTEVKNMIRKGRVRVNGVVIKDANTKTEEETDEILLDGNRVELQEFVYYMLHKPSGCVSATNDNVNKTVLDLLDVPGKEKLFPVGRLDKDTEGLLLLTNDGELAHRLLSPARHVNKTYYAKVKGILLPEDIESFRAGLDIGEEKKTMPSSLTILSSNEYSEASVTIMEGKFHQVKRMFAAVGKEVVYLKRLSMGSLLLDDTLKPGEYRPLTEEEITNLQKVRNNHE